jgi:hypothetical protein
VLEKEQLEGPFAVADDRLSIGTDARTRDRTSHFSRSFESIALFRVVEDVDAVVLADLLVIKALREGSLRSEQHEDEQA